MPENPKPTRTKTTKAPAVQYATEHALGGLDLGVTADQARWETGQRIAGQGQAIDDYLSQVLGERSAGYEAGNERDLRMQQFRRNQALMQEQLEAQRRGQEGSLARARMGSAASEAQAQRDFEAEQSQMARVFELGQIAAAREDAAASRLGDFGQGAVGADKGYAVSQDPTARREAVNFELSKPAEESYGWRNPFASNKHGQLGFQNPRTYDPGQASTTGYDELLPKAREIVDSNFENPIELQKKLLELYGGNANVASYALWDLGVPGAAPQQ